MVSKQLLLNIISAAVILCALIVTTGFSPTQQGSTNQWSPYQRVPGYSDATLPPYLIADQNNTIHAFTSQYVGQENPSLAVVYRQWSLNDGWSPPVDILLSPDRQARTMGAILDRTGMMHLIFYGGDQTGGDIYYSRAPAVNAGLVSAWSTPALVGRSAIDPSSAALAGDTNGNLVVIYSGDLEGNGLYAITSSDGGNTWSDPISIFSTNSAELWPFGLQLYAGESGYMHAVWNVVDPTGHNIAGYYDNLNLKAKLWSTPLQFDKSIGTEVGMGIANPTVIEYKNEVFITYNNGIPPSGVPPSQWYMRSFDEGKTWTVPLRISPLHVGRNGVSSFVVDSDNVLHLIFADRIPITVNGVYDAIGGIFHSVWSGSGWSEPQPIAAMSGSETAAANLNNPDFPAFAPFNARAMISQGNVILATWMSDPGFANNGVWYSYSRIDAPILPIEPLPTIVSSPTPVLNASPTPAPASPDQSPSTAQVETGSNDLVYPGAVVDTSPATAIMASVTFVVVLLSVVVVSSLMRRK